MIVRREETRRFVLQLIRTVYLHNGIEITCPRKTYRGLHGQDVSHNYSIIQFIELRHVIQRCSNSGISHDITRAATFMTLDKLFHKYLIRNTMSQKLVHYPLYNIAVPSSRMCGFIWLVTNRTKIVLTQVFDVGLVSRPATRAAWEGQHIWSSKVYPSKFLLQSFHIPRNANRAIWSWAITGVVPQDNIGKY